MQRILPLALCSLVAAGGFGAGVASRREAGSPGVPGRKVLYYVDPMNPSLHSDHPGIAPCGMALRPVYADEPPAVDAAPAGGILPAGDGLRQRQGVRVGEVRREIVTTPLRLFGRVTPDERRVYSLDAATDGSVRALSAAAVGTRVHRGQWLASIFSADSRTAMQAYITALDVQDQDPAARVRSGMTVAAGTTASTSAQFTVERLRGLGMSSAQIQAIRRSRRVPLLIDVHSPVDGFVLARSVSLDQKFERGAEWYRIADLDRVWVLADLYGADASLVRPGTSARVRVPGREAPLVAIAAEALPQLDPAARTVQVRFEVDNPGTVLTPGALVDLELSVERPAAVTIPSEALVDAGLHQTVFVESGPGLYRPRPVEVGWRSGDRVEIVRGLEPGERIVTAGTFLVDSETRLRPGDAGPAAASGGEAQAAPATLAATSRDPVCGMEVSRAEAEAAGRTADHGGRHFVFCSDKCHHEFERAPERYAKGGGGDRRPMALGPGAEAAP